MTIESRVGALSLFSHDDDEWRECINWSAVEFEENPSVPQEKPEGSMEGFCEKATLARQSQNLSSMISTLNLCLLQTDELSPNTWQQLQDFFTCLFRQSPDLTPEEKGLILNLPLVDLRLFVRHLANSSADFSQEDSSCLQEAVRVWLKNLESLKSSPKIDDVEEAINLSCFQ